MTNLIVKTGHTLLENRFIYDAFQTCVGAYKLRNKILSEALSDNPKRVLDLGCGTGMIIPHLSSKTEYFGIEISEEYAEYAKKRDKRISVRTGSVAENKLYDGIKLKKGDLVFALGLFHHLDQATISKMAENLQSAMETGAEIIGIDPYIDSTTSYLGRVIANNDRGKFIRNQEQLNAIFSKNGYILELNVLRNTLLIPSDILFTKLKRV